MARRDRPVPPSSADSPYAPTGDDNQRTPLGGYIATAGDPNPGRTDYRGGMTERQRSQALNGGTDAGYYDGDEYRLLRNMTPSQIARLQTQMAAAGLIGPQTSYIAGNAETTRSQFRDLLTAANGMGTTWQEALREMMATGQQAADEGAGGPGDGSGQLPTYVQPSREDLTAAIRRGLYTQFGTHNHAVDVEAAVSEYLGRHRAQFDAEVAGAASVEDIESVETFVENKATDVDAEGVEARQFLDRADAFLSLIQSPV